MTTIRVFTTNSPASPGTGKTLMARALSNECSLGDRKVAFFMRKGADVLSKWVGESERQLRLLFDQVSGWMTFVCVYGGGGAGGCGRMWCRKCVWNAMCE